MSLIVNPYNEKPLASQIQQQYIEENLKILKHRLLIKYGSMEGFLHQVTLDIHNQCVDLKNVTSQTDILRIDTMFRIGFTEMLHSLVQIELGLYADPPIEEETSESTDTNPPEPSNIITL